MTTWTGSTYSASVGGISIGATGTLNDNGDVIVAFAGAGVNLFTLEPARLVAFIEGIGTLIERGPLSATWADGLPVVLSGVSKIGGYWMTYAGSEIRLSRLPPDAIGTEVILSGTTAELKLLASQALNAYVSVADSTEGSRHARKPDRPRNLEASCWANDIRARWNLT